ncbi:uncharacterized protein LOC117610162 [Osmia lignaria lignaria]|uniref:uncharacterized protein LOC117610162 n=1 Tax=Osmia lignaria lignaria TaxID=1437193 RepID=UPI00402B4F12
MSLQHTHCGFYSSLFVYKHKHIMLGRSNINDSLISSVRDGDLKRVCELINVYGLSYSQAWSEGYVLLRDAIANEHTEIARLLLINGSKVNSKNENPSDSPLHLAVRKCNREIVELLLDRGADVNFRNERGYTALHDAVKTGNMEITQLLLNQGAYADAIDNYGIIPLNIAAVKGYVQIAKDLLNHGAYIYSVCTSKGWEGYMSLHFASIAGSEEAVRLFLDKGVDVNTNAKDNLTPLHMATKAGHETVVNLLLKHGAKVDAQDKNGKTALYLAVGQKYSNIVKVILKYCPDINNESNRSSFEAAVYGYRKEIVETFLQHGFTVNPKDIKNPKLLYTAVEKGYLKIVEDLLKYGANVNTLHSSMYKKGFTPLHNAANNEQKEMAKLLINYGANVNAKDASEKTPIFYAIENVDAKVTKLLLTNGAGIKDSPELLSIAVKKKCKEIVEILLQHDADINATDECGRTALYFTALDKEREIAALLLSKGANVNAKTKDGETTLHAAIENGCTKVFEALLEYNADVNYIVEGDMTLLHLSAQKGNEVISKMLLKKGVDVNATRKDRMTALHIAAKNGHSQIVEILLEFGAEVDFRDEYGRTALHIASEEGYTQTINALLEYGSDINIISKGGYTPLKYAMIRYGEYLQDRRDLEFNNYDPDRDYYEPDRDYYHPYGRYYEPDRDYYHPYRDYYKPDRDYYDPFPDYDEGYVEILKQYIVKVKTAGLYVNAINLSWINFGGTRLMEISDNEISDNEFSNFQRECKAEIEIMTGEKIDSSNTSFHDILTKSISQLAIYARNKNIVQALKSDDYKTKFPIYASVINGRFRRGIEKKKLLEQCNMFFHSLCKSLLELPTYCTEKVLSYLNDEDLRILIDACKPLNSPNTYISDVEHALVVKGRQIEFLDTDMAKNTTISIRYQIAKNIRSWILRRKYTVKDLANKTGIGYYTLLRYAKGKCGILTKNLKRIANELSVSVDNLLSHMHCSTWFLSVFLGLRVMKLNLQCVVCNHRAMITHCYVGHLGSVHDQRVFIQSEVAEYLNDDSKFPFDNHLVGDSGYELHQHLLVPFKDNGHLTAAQKNVKYFANPKRNIKNDKDRENAALLLSKGANVNAKTKDGVTTLHAAIKNGCTKVVEALLEYNADVNYIVEGDMTLLHLSAQKGNELISKMLLNKGADVNATRKGRITALHIAAKNGHSQIVEILLEFGAEVDFRDEYGKTALHIASEEGYAQIINALLEYGSDINIISKGGHTPLEYAMIRYDQYLQDRYDLQFNNYDPDRDYYEPDRDYYHPYRDYYDPDRDYYEPDRDYYEPDRDYYDPYRDYYDPDRDYDEGYAEILKQYIVKVKTAGLYVNARNLSLINFDETRLMEISDNEISDNEISDNEIIGIKFSNFQRECKAEIEIMTGEKIDSSNTSFYDILTKSISQLAIYARNKNIVQALKSDDYKTKFPIYASVINGRFRRGIEKKKLLEQCNMFFHSLCESLLELPTYCTEKILSYLNGEDLRILIDACKPLNSPNTYISDVEHALVVKGRQIEFLDTN